tara:strand:+ start:175 stop:459 length:285 start_codon:yes stop_codon:yes gene_type:complete
MDKHIEVVKKWLADNDSVSKKELRANHVSAYNAYINDDSADSTDDDSDDDAYNVAAEAAAAAKIAVTTAAAAAYRYVKPDAAHWVKLYEELTNE